MNDPNEIVNCAACSRPMMAVDRVCPACGAVQTHTASTADAPTFVTSAQACASCGRPLVPGATFCAFCGAHSATPTSTARRGASILSWLSGVCSVLAITGLCPPLFGLLAVTMAFRAQSRMPRHWVPSFLVGVAIAATAIGTVVWFVRLAMDLGKGVM